jgi:hypothetical protein
MLEPEIAFCDLDGLMEVEEGMISYIVQSVLKDCAAELKFLERDVTKLENVTGPFPRMSYDDAAKYLIELYEKETDPEKKELLKFEWGMDFGAPHEVEITKLYDKPVFVYGYPSAVKAFYMEPWPDRPEVCKSVDLLAPEGYGEICGGSERMSDHDALLARIKKEGCQRKPSNGIWNCANTARSPTRASAWAWNESPRGCAESNTSARRFPSRGRSSGCIRNRKRDSSISAERCVKKRAAGLPAARFLVPDDYPHCHCQNDNT